MKDVILEAIQVNNGIGEVGLALKLMSLLGPFKFDSIQFSRGLNELILNCEILPLKYRDRDNVMRYCYFTKGTTFLNLPDLTRYNDLQQSRK